MKTSRDGWALAAAFLVLVIICALFIGPNQQPESKLSTSYNADKSGVKAFYTLLGERLGYKVGRLTTPYTEMPRAAAVLVVVSPQKDLPIVAEERDALEKWVRGGGTVIFISDSLRRVPARFGSTRKLGKGFVYAMSAGGIVTNKGVRDYRNAVKVLDIISQHASPRDLVLFDEYHHGFGGSSRDSLLAHVQRQVKLGVALGVFALLLLCYGRGRRFGAVRNLPSSERLRPEFEFVESVARLYERAGATDLAAEILVRSMRQGLCMKLGLSSDAASDTIVRQLDAEGREQTARQVERLLGYEQAGHSLSKSELLHVAREIHSVEKELGLVAKPA